MSQPTSSLLPARKKRCTSAKGRMIAEALDNKLLDFARTNTPFTIAKVHNALLAQPELADHDKTQLRYHVRDRLNKLEEVGLAERVDVEGRNRPVYRLLLNDGEVSFDDANEEIAPSSDTAPSTPATPADETNDLHAFLERDRHHLNTQMQAAISEAEYYQQVLAHYPQEKLRITPLLDEAIKRSGTLKGKWDANLTLRHQLTAGENRA